MTSLSPNALGPQQMVPKVPSVIDRTHYSGPSGGSSSYYSHSSSSKGGKKSIALTALTLLSFLFFLNILQQCLQDHMDEMNPPQVVVMQAKVQRIREAQKRKGETDLMSNASSVPTVRQNPEVIRTNSQTEIAQIPIKLKTKQKSTKP